MLNDAGPNLGYFPSAKKCWLITKPEREENAKEIFAGTAVNISSQGQRHLGAVLGSREYLEEYVNEKVEEWVSEVVKLSKFAERKPQASFSFGLKHRWTYFMRTLADIEDLLEPLEHAIADLFITSLTERKERARSACTSGSHGWSGTHQHSPDCKVRILRVHEVSAPLADKIMAQSHENPDDANVQTLV